MNKIKMILEDKEGMKVKKLLAILLSLGSLFLYAPNVSIHVFASSVFPEDQKGTTASPYVITNKEQLAAMVEKLTATYRVANDIGSPEDPVTATIGRNASGLRFTGRLYGDPDNRPTIYLAINEPGTTYQGLIGDVYGGKVENIIVDGSVTGSNYVGGIAARATRGALIKNCLNKAVITAATTTANYYTGGIVGTQQNTGEIDGITLSGCENQGLVQTMGLPESSSNGSTGGIIGAIRSTNDVVENCVNKGTVKSSGANTGGIAGQVTSGAVITKCANNGEVSSINQSDGAVGGIAGFVNLSSSLTESFNTGGVTGKKAVGGICGTLRAGVSTIQNNYNTGTVHLEESDAASAYGAGILWDSVNGNVKFNYNAGAVTSACDSNPEETFSAAIGVAGGNTENNYYLGTLLTGTLSETNTPVALSEAKMRLLTSFSNWGGDIWELRNNGYDHCYPALKNNPHQEKLSPLNPPVIKTVEEREGSYFLTYEGSPLALRYEITVIYADRLSERLSTTSETELNITSGFFVYGEYKIHLKAIGDQENYGNSSEVTTLYHCKPETPLVLSSSATFTSCEEIKLKESDEEGIKGPKGIVFATVYDDVKEEGYTLIRYGMTFSKTNKNPGLNGDETEQEACIKVQAEDNKNFLGQYGVLFHGVGIKLNTKYYTRAYAVYLKDGQDEPIVVQAENTVEFILREEGLQFCPIL